VSSETVKTTVLEVHSTENDFPAFFANFTNPSTKYFKTILERYDASAFDEKERIREELRDTVRNIKISCLVCTGVSPFTVFYRYFQVAASLLLLAIFYFFYVLCIPDTCINAVK